VLRRVRDPDRLVFCLDTCHLFAAGYDIRSAAGLATTLRRFDAAVGLERVVALHLNDAKAGLGSGLDRHEHIGRGAIGLAAFGRLLRHPVLGRRPMVLETPKEGDWDRKNLRVLRRLRPGQARGRSRGSESAAKRSIVAS
jgi:deoxyribonuclease-4